MEWFDPIDRWIERRGISTREIARRIAVSDRTVHHWRNGRGRPDIRQAVALAAELGVTLDEVWGLDSLPKELFDQLPEEVRASIELDRAAKRSLQAREGTQ